MKTCGASTTAIENLIADLRRGASITNVLAQVSIPEPARRFVQSTCAIINGGKLHEIAAAFTFGREDLIPDMFRGFICDQDAHLNGKLTLFRWYMDRHIEVDGDHHGPLALRMVADLCGENAQCWAEAEIASVVALQARLTLWDGITSALKASR